MKFTLIICTYMRPEALKSLLETVHFQSLYPDEIIIVDGSTNDATAKMLEEYEVSGLEYYKVDEIDRGLTKQRNYGIERVGENIDVICFLDDDILLEHNYFEKLIATYDAYPEALAVGGYITNEVQWSPVEKRGDNKTKKFVYDGWERKEGSRFVLRNKLGLLDKTAPGYMPEFSNGRSVSYLPPSNKIYSVEQIMGGVSSYRKEIFNYMSFSTYFEGYGLYEDADFSLRLAKKGKLFVNTAARLEHHHAASGRPNKFKYGKMVIRNGWYVWRVKYENPAVVARFKWNAIALVLIVLRFVNVVSTNKRKEAFTEAMGRVAGWLSLIFNKPKVAR